MKSMARRAPWLPSFATLALAASFTLACVKPMNVSIDDMLEEISYDEVAALDKYRGKIVRIRGKIDSKGLKTRSEVVGELKGAGPFQEVKVTKRSNQVPYIVLTAASEEAGDVVCYFETPSEVAGLEVGQSTVIEGTVYRVKSRGGYSIVYMTECESTEPERVEDPWGEETEL